TERMWSCPTLSNTTPVAPCNNHRNQINRCKMNTVRLSDSDLGNRNWNNRYYGNLWSDVGNRNWNNRDCGNPRIVCGFPYTLRNPRNRSVSVSIAHVTWIVCGFPYALRNSRNRSVSVSNAHVTVIWDLLTGNV